jgi:hypothetical protein
MMTGTFVPTVTNLPDAFSNGPPSSFNLVTILNSSGSLNTTSGSAPLRHETNRSADIRPHQPLSRTRLQNLGGPAVKMFDGEVVETKSRALQ